MYFPSDFYQPRAFLYIGGRPQEERGGALGSTLESRHAPTDRRAADWRRWTRVNYFDRLLIIAPVYSFRKPLAVLRPSPVVLVPSEISPIRQLVLVWFGLVGYMVWHNWHSRHHATRAVRAIGLRTGARRTLKSQYGQIGD